MAARVALVHDFLLDLRGAERVFAALCDAWPDADVFTAVYDARGTEGRFAARRPRTSFLQRRAADRRARSGRCCRSTRTRSSRSTCAATTSSSRPRARGRTASWSIPAPCTSATATTRSATRGRSARRRCGRATRSSGPALRLLLNRWRQWDWIAAQRVDRYVANSHVTAARIERYFGRSATVLHPPVELGRFSPAPREEIGDDYVVLAELMAHKRIDVAIRAFNALGRPLTVIGDGPEARRLRRIAGPTVTFTGRIADAEVAHRLARARALVVTATEEFGIAAVEALAAGRPVIALNAGGVRESVTEGVTGTFYDADDPAALAGAVGRFDALAVDPGRLPRGRGALRRRALPRPRCAGSSPRRSRPSAGRGPASARAHRGLTNLPPRTRARGAGVAG